MEKTKEIKVCGYCGYMFDSILINQYKIKYCPKCGIKIDTDFTKLYGRKYIKLCQMNAVNPGSAKVMCDKYGEYYPKSYTIDFNDKGEAIHYCNLKDLKADSFASAFLCDLTEVK